MGLSMPEPMSMADLQANLLGQMKELIAAALTQRPTEVRTDSTPGPSSAPQQSSQRSSSSLQCYDPDYDSQASSSASDYSSVCSGDEELLLSDDGGDYADSPTVAGLFRSSLFKTILNKAKAVTQLTGAPEDKSAGTATSQPPPKKEMAQLLFITQTTKAKEIPAPPLFTELVQQQWNTPAVGRPPLNSEKRFYNIADAFNSTLEAPKVDEPIVALASPNALIPDSDDIPKAKDKKSEEVLHRGHQAAAWAVKAATSTSFFNRATLLWLKELQARVDASDTRIHQDINKLIAAVKFSANATLHAAKFVARSIGSSVVARRLIWLKHWQADQRQRWKLASSPFTGSQLFGDALKPVLIDSKDGRKKMSSGFRPPDRRRTTYFRKQSFRAPEYFFFHSQRQQFRCNDRQQSWPF